LRTTTHRNVESANAGHIVRNVGLDASIVGDPDVEAVLGQHLFVVHGVVDEHLRQPDGRVRNHDLAQAAEQLGIPGQPRVSPFLWTSNRLFCIQTARGRRTWMCEMTKEATC
jgi:hypothetical protein